MSQREEAEEEGVRPTETPLCGRPESQTGAQSPEQQRPESAGRGTDVEDNVSADWLGSNDIYDILQRYDSDHSTTSNVSIKSDCSKADIIDFKKRVPLQTLPGSPQSNRSHGRKQHFKENHLSPKRKLQRYPRRSLRHVNVSSDRLSRTSSGYSSTSGLSFKSDGSKHNIIDFKEGRSSLRVPLQTLPGSPQSNRSHGRKQHFKENHSSPKRKLQRYPRRSLRHVNVSSDRLSSITEKSPTSIVSFKSDCSKGDNIVFKERRSSLRRRDRTSLPTRPYIV